MVDPFGVCVLRVQRNPETKRVTEISMTNQDVTRKAGQSRFMFGG